MNFKLSAPRVSFAEMHPFRVVGPGTLTRYFSTLKGAAHAVKSCEYPSQALAYDTNGIAHDIADCERILADMPVDATQPVKSHPSVIQ